MRSRRHGIGRGVVPLVGALVSVLVLAGACSSDGPDGDDPPAARDGTPGASATASPRDVRRPTIRIGVTDWTGAKVDVAIAEKLIERRLTYPVEAVEVIDIPTLLDDLASGRIDAILELWPSSLEEPEREIIASGSVLDLGPLGVEGKIGWWVPRYVAEGELAVDDWEALAEPGVAAAFASEPSGGRGRFLGTNPAYEQHDEELIEALGLPFEVSYSGSDAATEAEVDAAVAAGHPILLYWWTPTALVARHDLVNVALPARTAECEAEIEAGGPARCDYPVDRLFKLASPALADKAPEVERFLRAFRLTTDDQLGLIDEIENGGLPVDEAVDRWIEANSIIWEGWLS